ncbi:phosphatase PAP2 family protein [Povalibacter sp.]|uniref:phosphatase PAP2 family protein n=1 Tax=Povalibacter sp. TaxID=1962978 RepID=UPI002F4281D9
MKPAVESNTALHFWWHAARWPLALALAATSILATTNVDIAIANALFFDAVRQRWLGGDSWWANEFMHSGGGWLVRSIIAAIAVAWIATFISERMRHWRRPFAYFLLSTLSTIAIIGFLKHVTNVDCPWDLTIFAGRFPYVHLFADRPDALRTAHCFPAAHAGSAYALMAVYFAALELDQRWARAGLAMAVALGLVFGIAQQSRGAHFVSHDLYSATIAWCVSLTLYCAAFRCRLWGAASESLRSMRRCSARLSPPNQVTPPVPCASE